MSKMVCKSMRGLRGDFQKKCNVLFSHLMTAVKFH